MRDILKITTRSLCAALGVFATWLAMTAGTGSAAAEAGAANEPVKPEAAGWPEFRGPWSNGHAAAPGSAGPIGLPLEWSEKKNIKWKTEIPNRGWSTPVVLEGRIWLTAATTRGNDFFVLRVDPRSGRISLNKKLFHADDPEVLGNNVNCYGSPSVAAEPGRVYVHFGTYGTACLDAASGEVLWERTDLHCRHYRGPGSSPFLFENLLVLSFDGVDAQYITALDKKTGDTVWKTDRAIVFHDMDAQGIPRRDGDLRKAFCTPLTIDVGGKTQLISLGSSTAFGYDPRTGKEIWRITLAGHSSSSRPVFGGGLLYASTGFSTTEMWALRPDGRGDVTQSHVAWKYDGRDVPQAPSPLLVDDLLFTIGSKGTATCLEAKTGEMVWSEGVGGTYFASPIYADGRFYCFSVQGKATVLKAGRVFEVLAENELDEGFMASPAVVGKALFLRTKTHLYRVESD